MDDPPALPDELRSLRQVDVGFARRVGIGGVLGAVLGEDRQPRLGRYRVERRVGEGGMGVVYRGSDEDGAPVAIKVLEHAAAGEHARFLAEVDALRALEHPRIVRYLDHGTSEDGMPFLAMEWLDGCDLASFLARRPLRVREALNLALAVAEGLSVAHDAGVIHRDIKPANLFLVGGSLADVRVIDFGIARATTRAARLTATGSALGTPCYMAPEQIRGVHDVRTDVYGLGATLFECLAGRPPFIGDHPGAIMLAVMAEASPPLSVLRAEVPHSVDALVARMLAKDVLDRPADMRALATEVGVLLSGRAAARAVLSRVERSPARAHAASRAPRNAALVGRARELAWLRGVVEESAEERAPAVVTIQGDAGVGKSALVDALAQAAVAGGARTLRARAARDAAGSPFALLAALLSAAGDGEPPALASLREQLSSLGARGPTRDARAVADQLRLAWLELLEAWTETTPLVVIIDDAHLADGVSLRFLESALSFLSELGDRAFALVATHRPPAGCEGLAAAAPPGKMIHLHLAPLQRRSIEELASRLAPERSATDLARLARLSGGNPSHLRELCRARVPTSAERPVAVAELVWERLARLDAESRRVLRAASIAGRRFSREAVTALVGESAELVERRLVRLLDEGLLRVETKPGSELEFESELVQLAARELCTADDLRAGHHAMAQWLEGAHATAALVAHHLAEAGESAAAAARFVAAARAALAGDDVRLADEYLARAAQSAADNDTLVEVARLQAEVAFWRGDVIAALESALAALDKLVPGTEVWFATASLAITVAGQRGDNDLVEQLGRRVVAATTGRAPTDASVIAQCRVLTQLDLRGGETPADLRGGLDAIDEGALSPIARGWLIRAHSTALVESFATIPYCARAHRAYIEGGDRRSAVLVALFLGSLYTWSGAFERARAVLEDALAVAHRLGATYLETWGDYVEGKLLVETAPAQAVSALEIVIERAAGSPRIAAGAMIYAALAAARCGDLSAAVEMAERARRTHATPAVTLPAASAACRALLARGDVTGARVYEDVLLTPSALATRLPEHPELVRLARAELAFALGRTGDARTALADLRTKIDERAAVLGDPIRSNEYLARPHLIVAALDLIRVHNG